MIYMQDVGWWHALTSKYKSHRTLKKSGFLTRLGVQERYEAVLNIQTGYIVWSLGPFPPGSHTDLLQCLAHKLKLGDRVEADKGYRGWP